jgi:hypothetical protein
VQSVGSEHTGGGWCSRVRQVGAVKGVEEDAAPGQLIHDKCVVIRDADDIVYLWKSAHPHGELDDDTKRPLAPNVQLSELVARRALPNAAACPNESSFRGDDKEGHDVLGGRSVHQRGQPRPSRRRHTSEARVGRRVWSEQHAKRCQKVVEL